MKRHAIISRVSLVVLTACGSMSQVSEYSSSQRYQDGIYYTGMKISPSETDLSQAKTEKLIARTKGSQIYLKGDRVDTLFIPENMSATLKFDKNQNTTTVTLLDMDEYLWDRYSYVGLWGYRHWMDPWYWSYRPYRSWAYYGFYDPFWYRPYTWYYDSWYYSPYSFYSWGWYDPFWYDPYYTWFYPSGWHNNWYYNRYYYGHHGYG